MADSDFTTVYRSQGMLAAQVIKGKLESAGVPVFLKYEAVGQVLGLIVDGLGLVRVLVPAEWADRALELLAEPVEATDEALEEPAGEEAASDEP